MILKLTQEAARILAMQDVARAMRDTDYDGASFECCEAFDDYRFAGLGDAILCNPGIEVEADVVEAYEVAYRTAWDRI
ncbi:MAG: hypothetical protein HKN10_06830 [Myxococcales bacterium]|nr:hypothetical protein [Myxococcales bacterium]